jgi:polyketide synthase PksM
LDESIAAAQASLGNVPIYMSVDAQDRAALTTALRSIQSRYGVIHGVIQAAIVLKDRSVAQMDATRYEASLAAKVTVSVRLAQALSEVGLLDALDWVLFFSSAQSFTTAAGQSNYAAGCVFQDAYAAALSAVWPCAVKVMNWGYWGGVGVVSSETYRARMAQHGIGSIDAASGMAALEALLAVPNRQLAYLHLTHSIPLPNVVTTDTISVLPPGISSLDAVKLLTRTAEIVVESAL